MGNYGPGQPTTRKQAKDQLQTEMNKRIEQLKQVHAVQGTDGNWNVDRYMRGMFNGLELGLAIMEDREPSYKEPPLGYLYEADNPDFKTALKALLNTHSWDNAVNLPDFLLADFLLHILQGMEVTSEQQNKLQSVAMEPMSPEGNEQDMAAAEAFRANYQSDKE